MPCRSRASGSSWPSCSGFGPLPRGGTRLLLRSIGRFSYEWSVEVVELLPLVELGFQIDVALVAGQLVKLLLVGPK